MAIPVLAGLAAVGAGAFSAGQQIIGAKGAADRQVRWERERATNAHQWEVKDLEAAGLNPVLSATSGGATTGSIAPTVPDTSGINSAANTLLQSIATDYDAKVKEAQAKNIDADTTKKEIETENISKDTNLKETQQEYLKKQMKKIESDILRNQYLNSKDKAEISKISHDITKIDSEVELIKTERELNYTKNDLIKEEKLLTLIKQKQGIETYKGQIYDNQLKAVRAKMRWVDETLDKVHSVMDIGQKMANMMNTGTSSIKNITNSIPIISKLSK